MSRLEVFCFGPPRLEWDGQAIEISLRKASALIVYLATTKKAHSRDALATLLWPDSDQRSARASLRRTLYRLNKVLGEDILLVAPETIGLNDRANVWLDIEAYQQHVAACLPPHPPVDKLSPECLARLSEAAALYIDDFLAGFTLSDSPDFDEWQFFQGESLRESQAHVLVQLVQVYQAQGDFEAAIPYARRWLALDPLHEPAHRRLMQLYDQTGQQAAALRQYEECVRLFEEELGLPPEEGTTTLYEAIKAKRLLSPFIKAEAPGREEMDSSATPVPPGVLPSTPPHLHTPSLPYPRPETRYVQSGDVHIAYQVLGEGPIDIVFVGGFVSHLEQGWEEPGLAEFFQRVASFSRLILFDKRGVGLSDRIGYPPSLENTLDDILAVMDAVGSQRAVLFGVSEGGPNSVLFTATYPERTAALILFGAIAKFTRSPDYPWALTPQQWDVWLEQLVQNWGGPIGIDYFAPTRSGEERFRRWWAQFLRSASSPGSVKAVLDVAREIDVRHILPTIHVPTLILHRAGDRMMRVEGARYMARQIPGAKYVELAGDDHWWWVGDVETILAEVGTFLEDLEPPTLSDRMLATVLSTEIVGPAHHELDEPQWPNLINHYQRLASQEVRRCRGRQIKRSGRHILATFDGPSRAIQCATAINVSAQLQGIATRAGLHTGECEVSERKLSGLTVQIAEEVMGRAIAGEVLVSSTVKDLVVGSGFVFEDRGPHQVAGIPGEWRLFALK